MFLLLTDVTQSTMNKVQVDHDVDIAYRSLQRGITLTPLVTSNLTAVSINDTKLQIAQLYSFTCRQNSSVEFGLVLSEFCGKKKIENSAHHFSDSCANCTHFFGWIFTR